MPTWETEKKSIKHLKLVFWITESDGLMCSNFELHFINSAIASLSATASDQEL